MMKKMIISILALVISVTVVLVVIAYLVSSKRTVDTAPEEEVVEEKIVEEVQTEEEQAAVPVADFYTLDLSINKTDGSDSWKDSVEMMDINGDGVDEAVFCEVYTDDEDEYIPCHYRLHFNDSVIAFNNDESTTYYVKAVHATTGNFIIVNYEYPFSTSIAVYDVDNDYQLVQKIYDASISGISDGEATIQYRVDVLGTWYVTKQNTYDRTGFNPVESEFILGNNPAENEEAKGLTLVEELEYTDTEGNEAKLNPGDVIYPIIIDGNSIEFTDKEGNEMGYLIYEKVGDFALNINGINEYDLFEEDYYAQ